MNSSVHTLLLYTTNVPSAKRMVTDTLRCQLGLALDRLPMWMQRNYLVKKILEEGYRQLSYVMDWQDAFQNAPQLRVSLCNINNVFELQHHLKRIETYELIVILHSAAGDRMGTLLWARSVFQKRKAPLVVFFGNEFNLMPEKITFARSVEADFIVSQLPAASAEWLYSDCKSSTLIPSPAALNPALYRPAPLENRTRDLGFRGSMYSFSIGDRERTDFILELQRRFSGTGLANDIRFELIDRYEWAVFLGQSRGIPGAESGTYYLEKDDHIQKRVTAYLRQHPTATFETVYDLFFKEYSRGVSGKAISSRHFEPIGTGTCQILLEGHYNGVLEPEKHYISVKKDLSNLDEAIRRFRDEAYRKQIARQALEHVLAAHTYRHRVDAILGAALQSM